MRKPFLLALACSAAAAACQVAFPFDRSLIPEEAGLSGTDASVPIGDDGSALEDSSPTPDASLPSGEAGDAALDRDGPVEDRETGDGGSGDGDIADEDADGSSLEANVGDAADAAATD
jgi:hypothetical protein